MKFAVKKIDVGVTMYLTGREVELLHHLFSYNNADIAKGRYSSHYAGGVTEAELVEFMDNTRAETGRVIEHVNAGKELLKG